MRGARRQSAAVVSAWVIFVFAATSHPCLAVARSAEAGRGQAGLVATGLVATGPVATGLKTGGPTGTTTADLWDLRTSVRGQIAPADEQAIQQLVSRLYDARVKKDVRALSALWAARAPRRISPSFPPDLVFPYERLEAGPVSLSRLRQEATSITARVAVDVTITQKAGEAPRVQRWIRNMGFVKEGDAWLIWRDAPAAEDLAVEIARAQTDDERAALLNAEPDLVNEELALALETQGDRVAVTGNLNGGLAFYQLALKAGEQVQSVTATARSHLKIGQMVQLNPGPKLDAIEHFQKALEGFTALGDRQHMASAERGLGSSNYLQDDQASREHYQKAIDILETLPDKLDLATVLHSYGNACYMVGDFGAALDAYHRSMSLQETTGRRVGIPSLLQAIGRVQKEQRDYDAAIGSYEKSLADLASLDYGAQFGGMTGLADVYRLQGRFDLSLEQYGRALALTRAKGDDQGAMQVEADIGNVYMSEQQPAAALDHYQKSLALAQQLKNPSGIARALAAAGAAYFAEAQYDAALDAYGKALAIQRNRGDLAWLHAHIGLVQAAIGKHDDALASYQKALDLSNELGDAAAVAVVQTLLATEHAELDHNDQALEMAERAASAARAIESDDTLAQARLVTARVLRKTGDREGAEGALQEAMAAIESGRARAGDEPRNDFFGDTRGPYRAMALLLADAQKPTDALLFAERAQLGLLADILTGNRSLITSGLAADEQEEERRLNRAQKSLRVQVQRERGRPKPDPARLETLKTRLADVEQQRKAFAETIYQAHASLKLQRGLFDAGSIEELQALVPDGRTAALEFVTTDKQTLVLALTRKAAAAKGGAAAAVPVQIEMKTIDVTGVDLARRVRDFRGLIRGRNQDIGKAARDLYDLLLQPVHEALAGKTRLVIVPDGPLWSLPFQALQSPDGRFLVQQCAVSYAPSLTALNLVAGSLLAPPAASRGRRMVAVGNRQAASAADRLKLLNPAVDLKPMPNAEQEVRKLTQIYGPKRAKAYVGSAVKQEVIRADARDASLLHLATFFVPSPASPMRSPIVLAAQQNGPADIIEAWELMNGVIPPVTIVSRVQAERVGGEGSVPVGLSWVFFVGGTRTAVLATWPDDSPAAVMLMLGLHRNLSQTGPSPATASEALRRAILPLLATKYKHPFYWANYAVIGVG